jgi:hypothetical protein
MRWRPYKRYPRAVIESAVDSLDRRGLRWLFGGLVAELEHELLLRDLAAIADDCGGFAAPSVGGLQ